MARLAKVFAVALLVAVLAPSAALADGDPASDILLGTNVFYPFDPPVSAAVQRTLDAATNAAQKAHVQVKVALIAAPTDLGVIPSLFGKPQEYADFLYREITFLGPQRLLVVMYDGYGTQGLTPTAQKAVATLPKPAGKTSTALAQSATVAVARIAAAEGHPIQAGVGVPSAATQSHRRQLDCPDPDRARGGRRRDRGRHSRAQAPSAGRVARAVEGAGESPWVKGAALVWRRSVRRGARARSSSRIRRTRGTDR